MHDDVTKLWMLLQIHRELVGHPKFKGLRAQVDAELSRLNGGSEAAAEPTPAPVYPRDAVPDQEGTESVPAPADRRV